GAESGRLGPDAHKVVSRAAQAAEDLMHYRHGFMHGWAISIGGAPFFIRNPRWHGEMRRRPSSDAHVDSGMLDMAIDAGWTLCRSVIATRDACEDVEKV